MEWGEGKVDYLSWRKSLRRIARSFPDGWRALGEPSKEVVINLKNKKGRQYITVREVAIT
jgi:hypothetical protein